ncbi:MAG TPA: sulfatase-like hydrolase/transferase [Vicinamibacteria bacterium]
MDSRRAVVLIALLGAGCSRPAGPRDVDSPPTPRVPVVIVTIDTLRADRLPAYGYRGVETPNLDALRRDAVLFQNAYSHCPLTLPSHVSLFTGLLPPAHGVRNNLGYRFDAAAHPSLPALLKGAGYATGAAVSSWVLRKETGLGASFDVYDDVTGKASSSVAELQRPGAETVRGALGFVRASRGKPFFLFVHLFEPHAPYAPPAQERARWGATYEGEIAAADVALGGLLDGLKAEGVYDEALIVVTSDHGEGLGEHGEEEHGILLYREVLHVPLLLKRPRSVEAGTMVDRTVGLVDVLPTVTASLGLPAPPGLAGRSLLAPAKGPTAVYSETYYPRIHLGWSELHSLVDDRFHLIDGPRPELYDLRRDPAERSDLAGSASATVAALQRELGSARGDFRAPDAVGAAERERLQALGYLAGGAAGVDEVVARANPRDRVRAREEMKAAVRLGTLGKDAAAVRALQALLVKEPGFFDAQWELGRVLARSGRLDEAARAYRRAMVLSPTLAPGVALALAEVSLARGDLQEAMRAAELASGDPTEEARASVVRAEVDLRQGRFEPALARVRSAEDRLKTTGAPPVPGLSFVRGDALARLNRLAEAELALREEVGRFPGEARAYASLALVVALLGRPEEAPGILEAMQRARPGPESTRLAARAFALMSGQQEGTPTRPRRSAASAVAGETR